MVETNPGKRTGNPDNTLLEALGIIKWIKCTQLGDVETEIDPPVDGIAP